jgi:hypothetical protein
MHCIERLQTRQDGYNPPPPPPAAAASPHLPWPAVATPAIVRLLPAEHKKALRLACKEACAAVDDSVTRLSYGAAAALPAPAPDADADAAQPQPHAPLGLLRALPARRQRDAMEVAAARWPALSQLSFSSAAAPPARDAARLLAALPALQALRFGGWGDNGALARLKFPSLRLPALRHLDLTADPPPPAAGAWGAPESRAVAAAVAALGPRLRTLRLAVHFAPRPGAPAAAVRAEKALFTALAATPMPQLERLHLFMGPLSDNCDMSGDFSCLDAARPLMTLKLPALRRLDLEMRGFAMGGAPAEVLDWLAEAHLPALTKLGGRAA